MALLTGRVGPMMKEAQSAGLSARDQRRAALAHGERATYCPPDKARINSEEMLRLLGQIPAAERSKLPLSQGMARAFALKWPCR
ncbi:MAG: hypothetical protein JSS36_09230 [Proteobacteria bacterium]|nr:hypothetical protein [Pseudomonadota bacterium]